MVVKQAPSAFVIVFNREDSDFLLRPNEDDRKIVVRAFSSGQHKVKPYNCFVDNYIQISPMQHKFDLTSFSLFSGLQKTKFMRINKKLLLVATICCGIIVGQAFAQKQHDDDHPQNLKVLPKDISEKDLHDVMKGFCLSLSVRCGFCHVSEKVEGQERPKFDFASDNKPEKNIARKMMLMTEAINHNYIANIIGADHTLEQITCVTCHMGRYALPLCASSAFRFSC